MKSLWDDTAALVFADDPLQLRVYTSRLLGQEPALVMHGGGNTSVKMQLDHFFGEPEEVLCIKGSGWDLATIEAAGFAPVKLDVLQRQAQLEKLTDTEMVNVQRSAMTDPNAPNSSVEAVLHAIVPGTFVDHTHVDAAVAITNTPNGETAVRDIHGDRVLVVPYVMPGFILARTVFAPSRTGAGRLCALGAIAQYAQAHGSQRVHRAGHSPEPAETCQLSIRTGGGCHRCKQCGQEGEPAGPVLRIPEPDRAVW